MKWLFQQLDLKQTYTLTTIQQDLKKFPYDTQMQ